VSLAALCVFNGMFKAATGGSRLLPTFTEGSRIELQTPFKTRSYSNAVIFILVKDQTTVCI